MDASDLKAKCERVRRWKAGDWLKDIYPQAKDRGMETALLEQDWRDVAVAYLAEHPADENEPVTEEWLRAVGFGDNGYNYAGCHLRLGGLEYATGDTNGFSPWFYCGVLITDGGLKTRGHVRRLCNCLGIPLTETPS